LTLHYIRDYTAPESESAPAVTATFVRGDGVLEEEKRPVPKLIAILVCDETIRDQATGKHTLVGLFNRIGVASFPYVHRRLHVFLSLTNGHGDAVGELWLVSRATDEVVVRLGGKMRFPDPLAVVEMDFCLNNIAFPKPGRYSFDFYCNGEMVGSRPFAVQLQEEQQAPD